MAFIETTTVEMLIRIAPTAGDKIIPSGAAIPAAKGMPMTLYPVAQNKSSESLSRLTGLAIAIQSPINFSAIADVVGFVNAM